jgi:hypothetical protein
LHAEEVGELAKVFGAESRVNGVSELSHPRNIGASNREVVNVDKLQGKCECTGQTCIGTSLWRCYGGVHYTCEETISDHIGSAGDDKL